MPLVVVVVVDHLLVRPPGAPLLHLLLLLHHQRLQSPRQHLIDGRNHVSRALQPPAPHPQHEDSTLAKDLHTLVALVHVALAVIKAERET